MKKQILTIIITACISIALFGGSRAPVPLPETIQPVRIEAQAVAKKTALIAAIRQDATDFCALRARVRQHRATYDALGITWVNGDFIGTDSGITATQFTSNVTNMKLIFDAYDSGATLSAGFPATIEVITY